MCLRFVFLLVTRLAAWLRLARREETWKTAEILLLRHQLTVLQRRELCRPKLTWADRALPATLLNVIPKAPGQQVRNRARELVSLAARHGITDLAFASPGRLRGHVADDRDLFDMFEFQRAATTLLGAEIALYSDGALNNDHVSADLAAATPL
jgi:hypothetical protein